MKIFTLKVVLALGSALTGTAAFAQEAADDATTGEIVVTAQRRSESLQKVPVSVTAVDVTPNYHPVAIRASALLLPMWAGEARGCVA
jgi:outer membrane cobalamin receptor